MKAAMTAPSTLIRIGLLVLMTALPAQAFAGPVVRIVVEREGSPFETGALTLVADEIGITSQTLLGRGDAWIVETDDGAQMRGSVLAEAAELDVVILRVPGLREEPLTLAGSMPEDGRTVSTLDADGQANRGIMLSPLADEPGRFRHTAMYAEDARGAPLLNNCGDLAGVNNETITGILRRALAGPAVPLTATGVDEIAALLTEHDIEFRRTQDDCLSLEEELEQARAAEAENAELERLLEEISERNAELEDARARIEEQVAERESELAETEDEKAALEELAETVQQRAAELEQEKAALEELAATVQERSEELEQANREREEQLQRERELRTQQYMIALGGAAVLLLLILVAVILLRKRKALLNQEQKKAGVMAEELSAAQATFPDLLLVGHDHGGQEIRIKINGTALIRSPEGQILGRDPRTADYVANVPEISRQHLRLRVRDQQIQVVDLDTYNGSAINGTALTPGQEAPLANGDTLVLGAIELQAYVLE